MIQDFNPYPANVENMVTPNNASEWQMGFNAAFKGLSSSSLGVYIGIAEVV